jgi:drug/metabolite transporter (DMT)-like permease
MVAAQDDLLFLNEERDDSTQERPKSMTRTLGRAYIELSAAMLIVGSIVVVSKVITITFPVFLAAALRFAIATAIFLPLLLKTAHGVPSLGKKNTCVLFLQAFAGNFLFSILLLYGLKLTSAAESGIILGTVPVVIGLISFLVLRESLTWNKGIALIIATTGIGVISGLGTAPSAGHEANPLLGNILVFGAVIGEALWTILGKAVSRRVTPLTIASFTSFFGLILFAPFAVYQASSFNFAGVTPLGWAVVVYYVLGTVAAYLLWYHGVSKVPASTAGVFTGIQPVSVVVLSTILLQEPMLWTYWVGIVSVLSAIVLMRWNDVGTRNKEKVISLRNSP